MTVAEAIDYINAHTWSQWKLGLLRFVHVAGSNGKGSTCAMLERILREAGYVTGFYPSPYIEDFRERIQVCGEYITEEALCRITARVRDAADSMEDHPSQFELITAIGMLYFEEKHCDIVVLEVGLGGTFDSTNVIDAPEAAVITNIGSTQIIWEIRLRRSRATSAGSSRQVRMSSVMRMILRSWKSYSVSAQKKAVPCISRLLAAYSLCKKVWTARSSAICLIRVKMQQTPDRRTRSSVSPCSVSTSSTMRRPCSRSWMLCAGAAGRSLRRQCTGGLQM